MSTAVKRTLSLTTPAELIDDIKNLRRGYTQIGSWTLPQIAWHLNTIMNRTMSPPPHTPVTPTPEARALLPKILAGASLPKIQAPEQVLPPAEVPDTIIDDLLANIERLKTFPGPFAPHRLFGDMTTEDYRLLHCRHASHHLSHLLPMNI